MFKVIIDAFNSFVHVYRSHIHLHLGDCPQHVVKCIVKGCHNFYALEEEADHDKQFFLTFFFCKKEMNSLREISTEQAATDIYLDIV